MRLLCFVALFFYHLMVFGADAPPSEFTPASYMERFNNYLNWYQHLPLAPSPEFHAFIQEQKPLSNKLREKWLYELARLKDWQQFNLYFQETQDKNLTCYHHLGQFYLGKKDEALKGAIPLWLSGEEKPKVCSILFELLLKEHRISPNLILKRIALALEQRNIALATYLLKHNTFPNESIQALAAIHRNPKNLKYLPHTPVNQLIYLYGLKRLVSWDMNKAIAVWQQKATKAQLTIPQQQAFLAHMALYKAMRSHDDALVWFHQVKPQFYNDVLLEWQIRYALKTGSWDKVIDLIAQVHDKNEPIWRYWLARALAQHGQKEQAVAIFQELSKKRHYYGFLASAQLHQVPHFENEEPTRDAKLLEPYSSIMQQIKALYQAQHKVEASRLLSDFMSELPKNEASALVYWIDKELHWYGRTVYLSSHPSLINQLALRFPLAYESIIRGFKNALVPEPLVYAIIRQESSFREDAVSVVGALGLMQIMPTTAAAVSRANKINYAQAKQLFDVTKNIRIGMAYLHQLAQRFTRHPVLIAAAYNAGPQQVRNWMRRGPREIDVWIETLPWQETRNYLKNIIAFNVVYQQRLKQKPNLQTFLTKF